MGIFGSGKKQEEHEIAGGEVTLSDGKIYNIAQKIDCIGDSCPRPQLMTKKALSDCVSGNVVEVLIDNPSSVEAIPPMLNDLNSSHLETRKATRHWEVFVIKN
jgi:tRNA 2-thiouridine synthesizing protein A